MRKIYIFTTNSGMTLPAACSTSFSLTKKIQRSNAFNLAIHLNI